MEEKSPCIIPKRNLFQKKGAIAAFVASPFVIPKQSGKPSTNLCVGSCPKEAARRNVRKIQIWSKVFGGLDTEMTNMVRDHSIGVVNKIRGATKQATNRIKIPESESP